jgi:hypothetical protein
MHEIQQQLTLEMICTSQTDSPTILFTSIPPLPHARRYESVGQYFAHTANHQEAYTGVARMAGLNNGVDRDYADHSHNMSALVLKQCIQN